MARRFNFDDLLDLNFAFLADADFSFANDISSINIPFSSFETFAFIDQPLVENSPVNSPVSATLPAAEFNLSSLLAINGGDGSSGTVFNGINSGDKSGNSVSSAGDINGGWF